MRGSIRGSGGGPQSYAAKLRQQRRVAAATAATAAASSSSTYLANNKGTAGGGGGGGGDLVGIDTTNNVGMLGRMIGARRRAALLDVSCLMHFEILRAEFEDISFFSKISNVTVLQIFSQPLVLHICILLVFSEAKGKAIGNIMHYDLMSQLCSGVMIGHCCDTLWLMILEHHLRLL
jgi:hypothetical protein